MDLGENHRAPGGQGHQHQSPNPEQRRHPGNMSNNNVNEDRRREKPVAIRFRLEKKNDLLLHDVGGKG